MTSVILGETNHFSTFDRCLSIGQLTLLSSLSFNGRSYWCGNRRLLLLCRLRVIAIGSSLIVSFNIWCSILIRSLGLGQGDLTSNILNTGFIYKCISRVETAFSKSLREVLRCICGSELPLFVKELFHTLKTLPPILSRSSLASSSTSLRNSSSCIQPPFSVLRGSCDMETRTSGGKGLPPGSVIPMRFLRLIVSSLHKPAIDYAVIGELVDVRDWITKEGIVCVDIIAAVQVEVAHPLGKKLHVALVWLERLLQNGALMNQRREHLSQG
ncbi:hypothetical protein KCU76_g69, partial [Aureobasidium melanogenum]